MATPTEVVVVEPAHHRWERSARGFPMAVPASGSTTQTVQLGHRDRALVIVLSVPTALTSLILQGLGSGINYLALTGSQSTGIFAVPVLPSVDDNLALFVQASVGGPMLVYVDVLDEQSPLLTPTSGGGGGGGAVTVADGADVAEGHVADAAWASGSGTVIALLKAAVNAVKGLLTTKVVDAAGTNQLAVNASGQAAIQNLPGNQNVAVAAALPAGANAIGSVELLDSAGTNKAAINASGQLAVQNLPGNQNVAVAAALPAGTNTVGNVGVIGGGNVAAVDADLKLNVVDLAAINVANAQQTSTATAATLLTARATRKRATIRNLDAANSVWLGIATVTTANGFILKAGESRDYFGKVLLQIIDNGAHAAVDIVDYYD